MSTHASIAIQYADGSVRAIYVHADGYSVGPILAEHYPYLGDAEILMGLGNLSYLGETCDFLPPGERDLNGRGGTCSYVRDRGEPARPNRSQSFETIGEWVRQTDYAPHRYLWRRSGTIAPGGWFVHVGLYGNDQGFAPVASLVTA